MKLSQDPIESVFSTLKSKKCNNQCFDCHSKESD